MDLQLKPPANACGVTQIAFQDGDRVVSFLVRESATGEFVRFDCLADREAEAVLPGEMLCRWTRRYRAVPAEVNTERALKMSAESLLLSLTEDPDAPVEENGPLKQFLALMLERKRLLRPRGMSADGTRRRFEHGRTGRIIEVPAGEMDAAFFVQMRDKLDVLLGSPEVGGDGSA